MKKAKGTRGRGIAIPMGTDNVKTGRYAAGSKVIRNHVGKRMGPKNKKRY